AMSRIRSAATGVAIRKASRVSSSRISERQESEEEARQPAHRLRFVDIARAAVVDACIGHLGGAHGVRRHDAGGIHHTGEAQRFGVLADADLLLARYHEIAV